jgi:hypothetical protein
MEKEKVHQRFDEEKLDQSLIGEAAEEETD